MSGLIIGFIRFALNGSAAGLDVFASAFDGIAGGKTGEREQGDCGEGEVAGEFHENLLQKGFGRAMPIATMGFWHEPELSLKGRPAGLIPTRSALQKKRARGLQ